MKTTAELVSLVNTATNRGYNSDSNAYDNAWDKAAASFSQTIASGVDPVEFAKSELARVEKDIAENHSKVVRSAKRFGSLEATFTAAVSVLKALDQEVKAEYWDCGFPANFCDVFDLYD